MTETVKRDLPAVVSQRERGEVVPLDRQHAPAAGALPSAVNAIMEGMETAVSNMDADDVSVEMEASTDGSKSTARFRLRAYRKGNKIVDTTK